MPIRPAVLRAVAEQDITQAHDAYVAEGGMPLGLRFLQDIEAVLRRIETHPGIGSTRYWSLPDMKGARCVAPADFPFLVFYMETEERLDVIRVLHQRRDIPALLRDD
ncbi:MAG: type II toxin-antitoxin system RelE/ParE family toxin [Alphaproteobacteria bacterium]